MAWKRRYGSLAVLIYRVLIDPLLWTLRPRIARICRELEIAEALDIASGTGAQCRILGRAGVHATGVDLSEEMIALARRIGGRNVRFAHGSACELPFDDASFDASLLVLALHEHTEEERAVMLSEAIRVLTPRGHAVVADYARPRLPAMHLPWQAIRLIEELAGPEHRAGFKDFVARGSLDGLLERHELQAERRIRSHFGAIELVVAARGA